jgi:hypothetical protein
MVTFTDADMKALRAHLAEPEQVAFAYARYDSGNFVVVALDLIGPAEIESRSDYHVELTDAARGRLIQTAWADRLSLVEVHSHGKFGAAQFSPSDLSGFDVWVPHLWWRLRGAPYAAMVMAGRTWDAMVWTADATTPQALTAITVRSADDVIETIEPTGRSLHGMRRPTTRPRQ